jgi:signal transduction histidine kinase
VLDQGMNSTLERSSSFGTFPDGGEMGELIRAMDWSQTPLGPIESWSPSLKMMVRILLVNRFPLLLWWGPQFIQIYNDAYRPVLGAKHPVPGLGQPVSKCWSEIWHILRPLIETPFNGGPATWMEDIFLEINRYGFVEETHFTIAYSPVPDETVESGIGGVLATVHEITEKVVGQRRMVVLRDLGTRAVEAKTANEACDAAAETLARHPEDIPFALIYLTEPEGHRARLAAATGVDPGAAASPLVIDLDAAGKEPAWPVLAAMQAERMITVDDLADRFGEASPRGPWSAPPRQAVVMPIRSSVAHQFAGFLVAGISSRLRLDESYHSFIELAASQIASAIASASAYDEERRRAEALAEIDRAKTVFFSNVSHEFRTPLTLMLGPLEDRLGQRDLMPPEEREPLELIQRNGLRLLKLVNTLLDFSRIEAGRFEASFEPVDLGTYTAELASVFRSAIEKAGLRLIVNCPSLREKTYVDGQMWEKIVLNLISNAFKFTISGEIEITLCEVDGQVELRVRDTGIGIPTAEIPRLFERFHRVKGSQGRTHEGTGIGLALVQELARLHGGSVSVLTEVGAGSTFVVLIPQGSAHLPPDQIQSTRTLASTALGATPYVEELIRWLPDDPLVRNSSAALDEAPTYFRAASNGHSTTTRSRILLADDNADMREYVGRLLSQSYDVEAVRDGQAALEQLQANPPDLVLADVMMPRLDGFGLLTAIRLNEKTRMIPVVMLSARAGEESRIEGLAAGADDYLIKPFSARELLARVEAHLNLNRVRREAESERELLLKAEHEARAAAESANQLKDQFLATLSHELRNPLNVLLGYSQLLLSLPEVSKFENLRHIAETLVRNAKSQSQLVNDLLDLSRLKMGKVSLVVRPVCMATMIQNAIETIRAEADAKQISIEVSLDDEKTVVSGDALRLQQVAWNLLNNAVKFTPPGGQIIVKVITSDDSAVLAIEDTGQGIDAAFLPHVFDMFRQADAGTNRRHSGMGIGLALVRQLVTLHGGTVTANSEGPGKGAQFLVHLPLLLSEQVVGSTNPARPESLILKGMAILVVDDSEDTVQMLRFFLERSAAAVTTANSGAEALKVASERQFDAILSDISMPGMDGFEFLSRLKEIPVNGPTPVLALTGFGRSVDIEQVTRAGFAAHFTKPLDLENLAEALSKIGRRNL